MDKNCSNASVPAETQAPAVEVGYPKLLALFYFPKQGRIYSRCFLLYKIALSFIHPASHHTTTFTILFFT
jgi:hypothetical protein